MKKLIALSFVVLTAFACKKEEVKPNTPAVPASQGYPALYAGNGMWTIDRLIVTGVNNATIGDTMVNPGILQFVNDSVLIYNPTSSSPNSTNYSVNAAKTRIKLYADNMIIEGPMTWTNANKMKFSYEMEEGSELLRSTFELTRQ